MLHTEDMLVVDLSRMHLKPFVDEITDNIFLTTECEETTLLATYLHCALISK